MSPSLLRITAVSFVIISGINFITVLPLMIGAIQDNLFFSELELGLIAAADTVGVVLSGWIVFRESSRFSIRSMVIVGLSGLLLAHLGSMIVVESWIFILIRFLGGLCGGIAYTVGLSYFAKLPKPHLGYSNYIITFSFYSAILLLVYPRILAIDYRFGFSILAGLMLVAMLIAAIIFKKGEYLVAKNRSKFILSWRVILILIAFFCFQGANASIYSFMERIGKEVGIGANVIGFSIGLSIFVGVLAGITVLWLSRSMQSRIQIIIGLLIMFSSEFFLAYAAGQYVNYLLGVCLLGFGFSLTLPNLFNLLASIDREGRNLALGTIANWLGQGAGPILAGWYLLKHDFVEIVWPSGLFLILSMLCIVTVSLLDKISLKT